MLMEKLNAWKMVNNQFGCEVDENLFSMFFQENEFGKTFFENICDLAYEVYQLQICMEGLLEDQDMDRKIRKIEKGVKKTEKGLKDLEKADKARDPACEMGKKEMLKKKKRK